MFRKSFLLFLCLMFAGVITGCSTVSGLKNAAFGHDQRTSVGSTNISEYKTAPVDMKGTIVAVKAINVQDADNGLVDSAIDAAGNESTGLAQQTIRSTAGYGGMMGMVGSVASKVAGSAIHLFTKKAKAKNGVLVKVKLARGDTYSIQQRGVASDFPIGTKVVLQSVANRGLQIVIAK